VRVARYRFLTTWIFDFAVDHRERPHVLGGRASGKLAGTGVWRLFEARSLTAST
jgi:hypothetical protein